MNRTALAGVGATLGVLAGAIYTLAPSAGGQGMGGSQAPLPGVDILSSPRLDVSATTAPGTYLAVAGDNEGGRLSVDIPGTVTLSSSTLAALNGRFCTPGGQRKEGVAGTVVGVPPIPGDGGTGAFPGRTSISLAYITQAGSGFLSCYASALDGGVSPVCTLPAAGQTTAGYQVDEGGSSEMEISDAYVLRCLHCASDGTPSASTAVVSYVEMDCNTP